MIKDLLVHLDGGPDDEFRLAYAEMLASISGAHLTGLFTNPLPDYAIVAPMDGGPAAANALADLEEEAIRNGDFVEQRLITRLSRAAVPAEVLRADGTPGQLASRATSAARCSDLFVASRPYGVDSAVWSDLFEAVLFESGRGMFVVPPEGRPVAIQRTLVCWRDTREAARAVGEALPIIAKASQTTVLLVDRESSANEQQANPAGTLVRHLKRYSTQLEVISLESNGRAVSEIIVEQARKTSADVIVMGGYGHSRLREWVMGGATTDMLSSSEFPILMAH